MVRLILATLLLAACSDMPVMYTQQSGKQLITLNTYPLPLCLFGCTNSLSVIKEDVVSGSGALTTGAKSTTSNQTGATVAPQGQ